MTVENWFPTPIYYNMIDNLDKVQEELNNVYIQLKKENKFDRPDFFTSSNHTLSDSSFTENLVKKYNLISFEKELFVNIYKYLDVIYGSNFPKKFKIESSWFTNTEKNQYSLRHNHGSADISGVYYLKTNELDGDIYFYHPCPQYDLTRIYHQDRVFQTVKYSPKIGKIILWPGWLDHKTTENKTENNRVSLSFNIIFDWY